MDDLISRKEAIDLLKQMRKDGDMVPWEGKDVFARIRELPAEPHWIPVTERLPKDGRQVLVFAMSVHYALAKYDEMRDADGTYKKQWVTFDAWKPYYTIKDVLAWMPLPEPYKGVNV